MSAAPHALSDREAMPKKERAIPLAAFHQEVGGEPVEPPGERLPEGPQDEAKGAPRRIWFAEWDGVSEVESGDALAVSANGTSVETLEEFKAGLDLSLREFLSGGDLIEAGRCIVEMRAPKFHSHIVKRAVALAMDKAGREREMVAVLLSSLHVRGVLTSAQVADGFKALLETIDDLLLDIPDAAGLVSHFLADSHLDGLLPLKMVDELEAAVAAQPAAASVLRQTRARLRGRMPLSGSQVDGATVRAELRKVVEEYLISHDVAEVGRRCAELCVPVDLQHELVRASIELAMERKDHDRELVSQLLSSVHHVMLPPSEISRGFEKLLARLDDLSLDNPRAVDQLAAFMTRAVADEILPPAFVTTAPPEKLVAASHLAALTSARAQLIASHFGDRRRHVWGAVADGSLADLKKEVIALWQECAVSGEVAEAVRCVRELEAPSYHHEVVKRAVSASIVDGGPREFELALRLTSELCEADVLTTDQLSLGCTRLVEASPDLQLDYPRAPELLAQYLERCCTLKLLTPADEWIATAATLRGGKANGSA